MHAHRLPAFAFINAVIAARAFFEIDIDSTRKITHRCQAAAIGRCDTYAANVPNRQLESGAFGLRDSQVIVSRDEPDLQFPDIDDFNIAWVKCSTGHTVAGCSREMLVSAMRVLRALRAMAPTLH